MILILKKIIGDIMNIFLYIVIIVLLFLVLKLYIQNNKKANETNSKKNKYVDPKYIYYNDHQDEIVEKSFLIDYSQKNLDIEDKSSVFYNKTIVFTGNFNNFSREMVAKLVHSKGACVKKVLSKNTDYVIIGSINPGPSKLDKIDELIRSGAKLKIISEKEFIDIIDLN